MVKNSNKLIELKVVSNGYTEKQINNLKPSNPSPLIQKNGNYQDMLGDYPTAENGNYILPTTEFGHPNDYKFTVDYPCRKTATGMFTDCGVYSANLAWSANPYKGLQCKLHNTKTPKLNACFSNANRIRSHLQWPLRFARQQWTMLFSAFRYETMTKTTRVFTSTTRFRMSP